VRNAALIEERSSPITDLSSIPLETFVWNSDSGWISWQRSHLTSPVLLCWLPLERRGYNFECHGTTFIIGAQTGIITILDFSEVIAML
jgi:hypothetical protein